MSEIGLTNSMFECGHFRFPLKILNTFLIVFSLNFRAKVNAQDALNSQNIEASSVLLEAKKYKLKIPLILEL